MGKIDVVELFAGVGGFRVGLNKIEKFNKKTQRATEKGDWNFVWSNQWEPSTKNSQPAYDCYIKRFGEENVSNVDISLVDKEQIPNHTLLVGGFPCQDYSVARSKSTEMGIQGIKGVLWWEIYKTLVAKKTPFVLLENVDRLLKSPASQRGRDFAVMLKSLENLGYIVQWRMINAAEYSMPQRRRRVFILATLDTTEYGKSLTEINNIREYLTSDGFFNDIFPIEEITDNEMFETDLNKYKDEVEITKKYSDGKFSSSGIFIKGKVYHFNVREITERKVNLRSIIRKSNSQNENIENYLLSETEIEKWEWLKSSKRIPRIKPNGDKYYYSEGKMQTWDSLDLPARTMLTSEGTTNRSSHAIFDEKLNAPRKITEIEAELIQMFPVNWTNTGMTSRQRYFMMGNALVTGVISRIEPKLKNKILLD